MRLQPRGTDGSLLASLPWTMTALSVALLPHIPYLAIWITVAFFGCAVWRLVIEKRRKLLPSPWIRGGLALIGFLGVFGTYSAISGVGPGSALLAIMAALKLLETRQRRDQFVLLFISIFLVMSSLLREQFLWSLPYLVGSILVILTAWLRMAAGESETAKQSFRTGGRLLMYAAPIAIAMWVFFPRLSTPFWAVPIDTSRATSGISDTMSPGDISSLSMSNAVAFRVQFEGEIPEPKDRYWRGLVVHSFNGRTWRGSDPRPGGRDDIDDVVYSGEPVAYEVTLEPTMQQWLFALDVPSEVNLANSSIDSQLRTARVTPIQQRVAYRAVSYPDYLIEPALRRGSQTWYERIPDSGNDRTVQLARDMRAAAGTDTDFINNVLAKFNQEEYFYTLQPPALGSNPIDRFLFDTRQGFCEHYASAFAFMMRAAGIPSRVILGYQGGEVNPMGGHLIVRQSDAHAWTEVWIDGYGWRRVDPTAAVAPERIEYGMQGASDNGIAALWGFSSSSNVVESMVLAWDALDAKWNEWVLGYGPENQNKFMEWLGMVEPSWRKMLLPLVLSVIFLTLAASALMVLRNRKPKQDRAAELYNQFVRLTGLDRNVGETAENFANRARSSSALPPESIDAVTTAYHQVRYGPEGLEAEGQLRDAVMAARST